MKEEKFLHIWTPQHGWGWGELQTLKGNGAIGAQKAKQREFTTEMLPASTSQPRRTCTPTVERGELDAEAQASGLRPQGENWD